MSEESFPVLEKPMTDAQWKSVARAFGTGVLDEGGNPYNLINLNNATNQGTIAVDTKTGFNHAVVSGYYHKQTANISINIPAVTAPTTYYIVLMYDPADKAKPVKLVRVTSLDRRGGKDYLVLWEVRRQPNQLLTDAVRTKKRPIVVPSIMVDNPSALPAADSVLWGTRAFAQQTGQEFRASYTSWVQIGPHTVGLLGMGGWDMRQLTGGISVVPSQNGRQCSARFSIRRTAAAYTLPTAFNSQGTTLGTLLPEGYRPTENIHFLCNSGDRLFEGFLAPNGSIQLRSIGGPHHIAVDNGFTIAVSWFVPFTY